MFKPTAKNNELARDEPNLETLLGGLFIGDELARDEPNLDVLLGNFFIDRDLPVAVMTWAQLRRNPWDDASLVRPAISDIELHGPLNTAT